MSAPPAKTAVPERGAPAGTADNRRQEDFRLATAAAFRAVAAAPLAEVSYAAGEPRLSGDRLRLPPPPRDLPETRIAVLRGETDSAALRLRWHDPALHALQRPQSGQAAALFDALEDARLEAQGGRHMRGIPRNIGAVLEQRYASLDRNRPGDAGEGAGGDDDGKSAPLAAALRLLARERLAGQPVPAALRKFLDAWRPLLGTDTPQALTALRSLTADQTAYAAAARRLIQQIGAETGPAETGESEQDAGQDMVEAAEEAQEDPAEEDGPPEKAQDAPAAPAEDGGADGDAGEETGMEEDGPQAAAETAAGPAETSLPDPAAALSPGYRIYTAEFDEILRAQSLCGAEEMAELRRSLDKQLADFRDIAGKLANRLQRQLMAHQRRYWTFDQEEGLLDASRLSRVAVNPGHPLSFKQERETPFRDTVVTLLLDNSGSMRGRPIALTAMSADILARTLERCGVKVEILGFTTRNWKGGQAREKWVAAGKPADPGRLNELRHIIYKGADEPYRRARPGLGLMLREGLLKENIDGEALLWAHRRLTARPEQRRILMVISDGAPVDDATLTVNAGNYLEMHLRQVIGWIENRGLAELVAIGIGHDVTRYYRHAVTIPDAAHLGDVMMRELSRLFDGKAEKPARRERIAANRERRAP